MARINVISRPGVDGTKDIARATYKKGKDRTKATSWQAQDNIIARLRRPQSWLAIVAGLSGALFQKNVRDARKKLKKAQKKAQKRGWAVRDTVQDSITTGLGKTRKTMQLGMTTAQKTYVKNARMAQENLKKAQKNLSGMQKSLQASTVAAVATGVAAGLAKTQDMLHRGSEKAGQGLQQITSGARGMKESAQDQYAQYQRKRQRARRRFRWGLIAGVVLALLFTPLAGSEVRRRLAEQWQQYRGYLGVQ